MSDDQEVFAFPASFAQRRLWFLDQLESGTAAYNVVQAFRLQGALDAGLLAQALSEIGERHESLRTHFASEEGQPLQVVDPEQKLELELEQLGDFPPERRMTECMRRAQLVAETGFDLSRGPLMRAVLYRLDAADHVLVVNVHHIVCDGWSMGLLFRELSQLYSAKRAGRPVELPAQDIQYADYALWQHEYFQGEQLSSQLKFWIEYLSGELPVLALPWDRGRPQSPSMRGGVLRFDLDAGMTRELRALAAGERVSLFMVLLSAFQVFLARVGDVEDVVVGSPIANRDREEVRNGIGFYTNTVVFRAQLDKASTFRELLRCQRDNVAGVLAHQEVPLEQVVEAVQPDRRRGENPLFQVMFALQKAPESALRLDRLEISALPIHSGTSKFDLLLELQELDDSLQCFLEYALDLFDEATAVQLGKLFRHLLRMLLREPDRALREQPLLSEAELTELRGRLQPYAEDSRRVCDLVSSAALEHGERTAVEDGHTSLSYRELDARANQLARYLVSRGVERDTLVAVFLERGVQMVVALLGIMKAGAAYLPLDPEFPQERLAFMLKDSGARWILTEQDLATDLPVTELCSVVVDGEHARAIAAEPTTSPAIGQVTSQSLAYLIYTSGSTGKPKGVEIPHSAVVNFLLGMQEELGLVSDDRLLAVTTLSFDIAVLEVFLPLIVGASVVVASQDETNDGQELLERLEQGAISVMQATPATWQLLLEVGWQSDTRLRRVLCGGEAWPAGLAAALLSRSDEVWNMYGPTETTVWSSCSKVTDPECVEIGRAIRNTALFVLDQDRQPVPAGLSGELYIGGAGLARGYRGRDQLTRERFVDNPFGAGRLYRTGDRVRCRLDGGLLYQGRFDDQVKLRGHRIELGEIEAVLQQHEKLKHAVVNIWQGEGGDQRLVAYVVFEPGATLTGSEMRKYLRAELPDYMIPQLFVELPSVPLTANNKIDRAALPDPLLRVAAGKQGSDEPKTKNEKLVASLWRSILKVEQVGVADNFFDLGGHSLLSTQFTYQLERETGHRLSPRAVVFENLKQIAAQLP